LVVDLGYDPSRSSPSDRSPGCIRARRTPVLSTVVQFNSFESLIAHQLL